MVITPTPTLSIPTKPVVRRITIQLTRDGEQTQAVKMVRLLDDELLAQVFFATSYSSAQYFLAGAVDRRWMVIATDETTVARAAARYVQIDSDITISMDLNDGSGGGGSGDPASIETVVRLERLPVQREIVVLDHSVDGAWRVAGSGITDETGAAQLDLRVTASGRVYALASDDFGLPFQEGLSVAVGSRIRPTYYAGWLYEITDAGQLPSAEPEWWAAVGENPSRPLGTARAVARRYYQPIAHGPIPVEVV